jgi:futalosine hydrolase
MKILIVSATPFEIATLIETLGKPQTLNNHLSSYHTQQHQIDILITGVGMVFTTFHLSMVLSQQKYDCAINAGVAGAIDKSLSLGQLVNVTHDFFYELGAENGDAWLSLKELSLLTENDLPYTNNGLLNNKLPNISSIKELKQVFGQTVNKVHGNMQSIKILQSNSEAQIESMEGAAFLFCCLFYSLPCAQIRAISNFVEVRNKDNWKMKEAIINLNDFLKKILIS